MQYKQINMVFTCQRQWKTVIPTILFSDNNNWSNSLKQNNFEYSRKMLSH